MQKLLFFFVDVFEIKYDLGMFLTGFVQFAHMNF